MHSTPGVQLRLFQQVIRNNVFSAAMTALVLKINKRTAGMHHFNAKTIHKSSAIKFSVKINEKLNAVVST